MKVVVLLYVYVYNYVAHFLYFRKYDTEVRKYEGIFPYEYSIYSRAMEVRTEVFYFHISVPYVSTFVFYTKIDTFVLSYEDTYSILSYEGTFVLSKVRRYFHRA